MKKPSHPKLKLTILGSGTSTGVPLLSCRCKVCRSKNPKNSRTRASAWVETRGKSFLIDTSTDLRAQALREKLLHVDAILFTHPHADHVSGIDEVRAYNYIQKSRIPAYGNHWTCTELRSRYPYIFAPTPVEGGGIPLIDLQEFDASNGAFEVQGVKIIPLSLLHGSKECIAYRIGNFAYVTDCNTIPEAALAQLQNVDLLVLDCLRIEPHRTHLNLEQALAISSRLKPKKTVLTHLGHDFDYAEWTKKGPKRKLPPGVTLAYDGLKISV